MNAQGNCGHIEYGMAFGDQVLVESHHSKVFGTMRMRNTESGVSVYVDIRNYIKGGNLESPGQGDSEFTTTTQIGDI